MGLFWNSVWITNTSPEFCVLQSFFIPSGHEGTVSRCGTTGVPCCTLRKTKGRCSPGSHQWAVADASFERMESVFQSRALPFHPASESESPIQSQNCKNLISWVKGSPHCFSSLLKTQFPRLTHHANSFPLSWFECFPLASLKCGRQT